jgi:hypothetical protein
VAKVKKYQVNEEKKLPRFIGRNGLRTHIQRASIALGNSQDKDRSKSTKWMSKGISHALLEGMA